MAKRTCVIATAAGKGKPDEVVEIVELDETAFDPEDDTPLVKVKMAYAAIHPSDCNVLEGTYMKKITSYPSTPVGYEGSGFVVALSKGAQECGLKEGDTVIPKMGADCFGGQTGGAWVTSFVTSADALVKVPEGINTKQAALIGLNPMTAVCMLKHGFAQPGSWVVQNLGSSAVGLALCSIAKRMGIKTCSIVRRADVVDTVKAVGGDVVVVVDHPRIDMSKSAQEVHEEREKQIAVGAEAVKAAMAEVEPKAKFGLAIDGVGGASAGVLLKCLAPGGQMLTYGNMSREPIQVGGGQLIFKLVRIGGFVLWNYMPPSPTAMSAEEFQEKYDILFDTFANIETPIAAVYPLAEVKEGVKHAFSGNRNGKVLLKCNEDVE